jgi:type II secretory pathway predicted ATPase ExeA
MGRAELNTLIMKVARRAENAPPEVLRDSFVPVGSLLDNLGLEEHHVVLGRRGTGKTHLMRFLQERRSAEGSLAVLLDPRQMGAAENVFSTQQDDFAQQTTALLVDVVEHVHTHVLEQVLSDHWSPYLTEISEALDALAAAATQIRVVGETEVERQRETSSLANTGQSMELSLTQKPRAARQR